MVYLRIFRIWRAKRMRLFLQKIGPVAGDTILDVGGSPSFWEDLDAPRLQITCLNRDPAFQVPTQPPGQGLITKVYGDGRRLSYADRSFAIGFSNSVIEHVGTWEEQKDFAREMLRVGQKIWVQTPAYECPIEPHFLAPFFHWLPSTWRKKLARNFTAWGWMERPSPEEAADMVREIRLLRKKEMHELFPTCEIITEKLWGVFPKSYIAVRR
jgi:hypothetical protein